ncbi:MAG: hypothetical protein ACOC3U_00855 [Thiohalospira sp.]
MKYGSMLLLLVLGTSSAVAETVERPFNGGTLEAEYIAPSKAGRGVVLLYPDTVRADEEGRKSLQEALTRAGYGVLVARPGGDADCSGVWRRLHRDGMDEVGGWFDWLLQRGISRVHFLGSGRGGNQVAWFLARSRHPALGTAILLDPMVWRRDKETKRYEEEHGRPLEPLLEEARELREQGRSDETLSAIGFLHCEAVDVTAAALLSYYADEPNLDTSRLLDDLPGPATVLVGPDHEGRQRLQRAAEGGKTKVRLLEKGVEEGAPSVVAGILEERGEDAAGR